MEGGAGVVFTAEGAYDPNSFYFRQIQNRIVGNWQRLGGQGRTMIFFRINRDGTISGASIETTSGNSALDQSALMAVQRTTDLGPLPSNFGDKLGIHFWFNYVGN